MKKNKLLSIKIDEKTLTEIQEEARHLGFFYGKGNPSFSSFCRWILKNGMKPVERIDYKKIFEINLNLVRLGGLLNQNQFNANRELKILYSQTEIEKTNKGYLLRLDETIKLSYEIQKEIEHLNLLLTKAIK